MFMNCNFVDSSIAGSLAYLGISTILFRNFNLIYFDVVHFAYALSVILFVARQDERRKGDVILGEGEVKLDVGQGQL